MKVSSNPPNIQNTNFERPSGVRRSSGDRNTLRRNICILTYFLQQHNRNLELDATQLESLLESQLARLEHLKSRLAENNRH